MHYSERVEDTIAAISTPPGEGGIAVIRVSGKQAVDIIDKVFSGGVKNYKTHTVHYGQVIDLSGDVVDDVLLSVMLAPRSYTGENTVEINCHGGILIARRVLETVLGAGALAALPGEFTFQAFVNGKLDLAQAEAVQELIAAKNEMAMHAATDQLHGRLSEHVSQFKGKLTDIAAMIEAWVDFPEEDLEFASVNEVADSLRAINGQLKQFIKTFHDGRLLREGVSLCLIGRTNVGKSSLMNALLDKDRAIVTEEHGTTRDILEDDVIINGLNFRIIDTAGIRETKGLVEQEGIRRSRKAMTEADLVLFVVDAFEGVNGEDLDLLENLPSKKTIVVWNKVDLVSEKDPGIDVENVVAVSALQGTGLDDLKECIDKVVWKSGPPSKEEIFITNTRHKEALEDAVDACDRVIEGLCQQVSPEFVAFDMRQVLVALGRILGTDITEDILSVIFSKFCIGK